MFAFFLRRLGITILMVVLSSFLIFGLIKMPPGSIATREAAEMSKHGGGQYGELVERLKKRYGLNKHFILQYWDWFSDVLRGNFGRSNIYKRPVSEIILSEVGWTIILGILILTFAWSVGIVIGIYSATHQYSFGDHLFTTLGFLGISIPNFFLAMLMIYILVISGSNITGGLFSSEFKTAPWNWAKFIDLLKHIWMPVLAVGTAKIASVMRIMRNNLLEEINKDYIRTARAKGLSEIEVWKHGVRVAINPLISKAGMQLSRLFNSVVLVAVVLSVPVIGPTFIEALKSQDTLLASAYLLIMLFLVIIGNFFADMLLAIVDPRIKYY